MKVFYESKLAKIVTFIANFSTIMLFGAVFTEKSSLTKKELEHERVHCLQYRDCFAFGLALAIIGMFILFIFDIRILWPLFVTPIFLFYIWYAIEFLVRLIQYKNFKTAYKNVGFEKQAYRISDTWDKPCEERVHYYSFGWLEK